MNFTCSFFVFRVLWKKFRWCLSLPFVVVSLSMPQIYGSCWHLKGSYDNHSSCLNCSGCFRSSCCSVCRSWPNHFVFTQTFKIETQRKVKDAVQLNDWAFSLDLTDAYLHIPIHHRSRKYLRFMLGGRVYQFKALPFGLSTSPFVFTRLMIVIATFLRRRAITLHPYLNDWLAGNQNRRRLLEH